MPSHFVISLLQLYSFTLNCRYMSLTNLLDSYLYLTKYIFVIGKMRTEFNCLRAVKEAIEFSYI